MTSRRRSKIDSAKIIEEPKNFTLVHFFGKRSKREVIFSRGNVGGSNPAGIFSIKKTRNAKFLREMFRRNRNVEILFHVESCSEVLN